MSLPAPLARGLLVTASLAGMCLAVPAAGQYGSTQPFYSTGQVESPSTNVAIWGQSGYGSARYYQAQAPMDSDASIPEPPQPGMPGADGGESYVPVPPQSPGAANGYAYPGPHAASTMPGAGQQYGNYSPACNCLDGGYNTWGLWGNYAPTSPCSGASCDVGGRLGPRGGGWFSGPSGYGDAFAGGCTTGCTDVCTSCQTQAPCRVWFGGIYALYMDRDNEDPVWTSFDSSNLAGQGLSSRDASDDWQTGNEVRFGSTLLCHCLGWEAVYWGLWEEEEQATVTAAALGSPVSTTFDFGGLDYDSGGGVSGVNSFFDNAQAHRIRRDFAVQNIELNLLYYPLLDSVGPYGVSRAGSGLMSGRRFSLVGSAGVRYMRIDDGFEFASSLNDTTFGNDPEDIFYQIDMENHLVGVQLGAAANYRATQRLSLFVDSKFGIFGNYIEQEQRIFGTNGVAVVTAGLPFEGEQYDIQSDKEDVAFLGELRAGVAYWVTPRWRLYGGWRAVGIAGYAHPTEQIPLNFAGTPDVRNIDSNGSLILHGLQTGVELNY